MYYQFIFLHNKEKLLSLQSNLQQINVFRRDLPKMDIQLVNDLSMAPNITRTTNQKDWKTPTQYPKHDIREFHSNEFTVVFSKKAQGKNILGMCVIADTLVW